MLPCSAADFAEDLSVMNAKERKKEKRRSEREALQTTMATGKAARDAAARIAKESSTPEVSDATPTSCACSSYDCSPEEDQRNFQNQKVLHEAFVARVAQVLEQNGLEPANEFEFEMLSKILEQKLIPPMAQGLHDMRMAKGQGFEVESFDVKVQWELTIDGAPVLGKDLPHRAKTQQPQTTQEEPAQGPARSAPSPLDGKVADKAGISAEGLTDEVQAMWDIASQKAALEGGDEATIHKATLVLFRAMKKKKKAKDRKQTTAA